MAHNIPDKINLDIGKGRRTDRVTRPIVNYELHPNILVTIVFYGQVKMSLLW